MYSLYLNFPVHPNVPVFQAIALQFQLNADSPEWLLRHLEQTMNRRQVDQIRCFAQLPVSQSQQGVVQINVDL